MLIITPQIDLKIRHFNVLCLWILPPGWDKMFVREEAMTPKLDREGSVDPMAAGGRGKVKERKDWGY